MHQTQTGVSETGYPGNPAQRNDSQSPALSSSTEQEYSKSVSEPEASKADVKEETKTEVK